MRLAALALVLALVMALSLVALPSFAADEDSTGTGTAVTGGSTNTPGLELRKIYDPSKGLLTLEAYATGSTTTAAILPGCWPNRRVTDSRLL